MDGLINFFVGFGVFAFVSVLALVIGLARVMYRTGRRTASLEEIAAGTVLFSAEDNGQTTWSEHGGATVTRGLSLLFNADDDPQAEATFWLPGVGRGKGSMANSTRIQLQAEYATVATVTSGHAFVVRLRGTGKVVGKYVKIQMLVDSAGKPLGVGIENDDKPQFPPAVGDWIEISSIAIVRLQR